MPAPYNYTLLDYETNIEDTIAAYLVSQSVAPQVLTPRTAISSAAKVTTPRILVSLSVTGTNPNQQSNRATDSGEYDSHKSGVLKIICVFRRDSALGDIGKARGKVRVAMLKPTAAFSSLAYYEVVTLRELSSALSINADNDEIMAELSYEIQWFILPNQWAGS